MSGFEEVKRVYTERCSPTPSACHVLEELEVPGGANVIIATLRHR